jgi:hypothetical protein
MIFFLALGYKAKGYFGFGMRVGSGTKRVAERLLWIPRRDAGVGVVQAVVEGHDGRVDGFGKDLLVGRLG